jgi:glycosyltransferase involved in cell wall biosynthesis
MMSGMAPRVSVVIPAYNAEKFIARTLETVAAQTYRDFEVVLIDDGSADATFDAASAAIRDLKIPGRAHRQANKMIAGARNAGVERAQGEFISFLDADDSWLPKKLETVMAEFDRVGDSVDLVSHDEEVVSPDGTVARVARHGPWVDDMYDRLLYVGNALSPSAVTVRRAKVLEVGGFRENPEFNTVEDYDFWMRLSKVCRFHFMPVVLGSYNRMTGSASNKVVYHHANLESLIKDHFASQRGGLRTRARQSRRLASVYRSCARALLEQSQKTLAREYAWKALRACPWDPKNAAVAALCLR